MFELEPELKKDFTKDQLEQTFDTKPKLQRAAIMLAGPVANFILSIFIFSFIFSTTPDPQSTLVINEVNNSNMFEKGDQITSIDGVKVSERKDISLELLSKAGMTGELLVGVLSKNTDSVKEISLRVDNFLTDSEQQKNPVDALNIVQTRMLPIIGSLLVGGAAELGGLNKNDRIIAINNSTISYASEIPAILNSLESNLADIQILEEFLNYL